MSYYLFQVAHLRGLNWINSIQPVTIMLDLCSSTFNQSVAFQLPHPFYHLCFFVAANCRAHSHFIMQQNDNINSINELYEIGLSPWHIYFLYMLGKAKGTYAAIFFSTFPCHPAYISIVSIHACQAMPIWWEFILIIFE